MKSLTDRIKALGDETRLRIVHLLGDTELCVCDLFATLDLPQSTVSRHLAILRRSGWVSDQRRGSWMYYRLAADAQTKQILSPLLVQLAASPRGSADREALQSYLRHKDAARCR